MEVLAIIIQALLIAMVHVLTLVVLIQALITIVQAVVVIHTMLVHIIIYRYILMKVMIIAIRIVAAFQAMLQAVLDTIISLALVDSLLPATRMTSPVFQVIITIPFMPVTITMAAIQVPII